MIETPFGVVSSEGNETSVYATGLHLYDWATRPGAVWPCSALRHYDEIEVSFVDGDLVEIRVSVGGRDDAADDLLSDELNAWSSDVLRAAGLADHLAIRS